jgi:hypothetical protein
MGTKPFPVFSGLLAAGLLLTGCETTPSKKAVTANPSAANPYASGRTAPTQTPTAWDNGAARQRGMTANPVGNSNLSQGTFDAPGGSANAGSAATAPALSPQANNAPKGNSTFGSLDPGRGGAGLPPGLAEQPAAAGTQSAQAKNPPPMEPPTLGNSPLNMPPAPNTDDRMPRPAEAPSLPPPGYKPPGS